MPPLAADKSQARANQAAQIRALGPQFHAVDEISWNGWNAWVDRKRVDAGSTPASTARQRLADAGFDVGAGDTWALNELSSAVRKGTAPARRTHSTSCTACRATASRASSSGRRRPDDDRPRPLQGQPPELAAGRRVLEEATGYVSDWAQENYGDIRSYAVAGSSPHARRDELVQYLGHEPALAAAGPDAVGAGARPPGQTYVTFGNAAWAWGSSYGWTAAPLATMQDFVSGQVYASRAFAAASGATVDRFGFAWAPNNTQGLTTADFNAQSGSVLDRLASAIRDSGVPADDTGLAACLPSWCATALDGAAFTTGWQSFSTWSTSAVAFATPAFQLTAGTVSAPVTLQMQTAGAPDIATSDQVLTLASTSPNGGFSTVPTGPFTPTLTVTIPTGASSATVYYTDTLAGTPTLTAGTVAQIETVVAAPVARLALAPVTASVRARASQTFTATGFDAYGNAVLPAATWTLSSSLLGGLSHTTPASTLFIAGTRTGSVQLTATSGGVSASASITVTKPPLRLAGVGTKMVGGHVVATARVLLGSQPAQGVPLTLRVRRGSSVLAAVHGRTAANGKLLWRSKRKLPRGRYVAKADRALRLDGLAHPAARRDGR